MTTLGITARACGSPSWTPASTTTMPISVATARHATNSREFPELRALWPASISSATISPAATRRCRMPSRTTATATARMSRASSGRTATQSASRPDVVFGAYRVFGCAGSTTSDIMLAAMEAALADDMDVLNMSIGSRTQWPQYPTAAAATRLLKKGMVVVASIGNNGPGGSASGWPLCGRRARRRRRRHRRRVIRQSSARLAFTSISGRPGRLATTRRLVRHCLPPAGSFHAGKDRRFRP